jgi:hypothetical protein
MVKGGSGVKRFQRAERFKALNRTALCGPSGSGKTMSALLMAKGFGGTTALIDTEHGRGQLYANEFDYDVAPLSPPFTPERYAHLIQEAGNEGYQNLVIDGISHEWAGKGGILEQHDEIATDPKLNFSAWRTLTPKHNEFIDSILASPCHVWVCIRSKTSWVLEQDKRGKHRPVKVGQAPIQRDGIDYEFLVFFQLRADHMAICTKDLTGLFDLQDPFLIGEDTGSKLLGWLQQGRDPEEAARILADQYIQRVEKIGNVYELRNFWKKHQSSIESLPHGQETRVVKVLSEVKQRVQAEPKTHVQASGTEREENILRQAIAADLEKICKGRPGLTEETILDCFANSGIVGKPTNLNALDLNTLKDLKQRVKIEVEGYDRMLSVVTKQVIDIYGADPDKEAEFVGLVLNAEGLIDDPVPTPLSNLPLKVLHRVKPLIEQWHRAYLEGPAQPTEQTEEPKPEAKPKPKAKPKAKAKPKPKKKPRAKAKATT